MRRLTMAGALICSVFIAGGALAQTAEHVAAVQAARAAAAPAPESCAPASEDIHGWPAKEIKRCDYRVGELPAIAYVLDPPAERIAQWIETGCAEELSGMSSCVERVLKCALDTSGLVFPVAGNAPDAKKGLKNQFYRNGVAIAGPFSGKAAPIEIAQQEKIAHAPDAEIQSMPTGAARFWRTLPFQLSVKAPETGAPGAADTPERRIDWLAAIKTEMTGALASPRNRMLTGWMHAHPITIRIGDCPDDRDP
jgi:hypothetical protein